MAEILRIKEVLQKAKSGKRCLIILDEMFRGTNAQDAFEASVAVNEILKKYLHCSFLISTHILEYAQHFEKDKTCCFYYMDSKIENGQFLCSYQLRQGISEAKVGYWLVKRNWEDYKQKEVSTFLKTFLLSTVSLPCVPQAIARLSPSTGNRQRPGPTSSDRFPEAKTESRATSDGRCTR